MDYGSMVGDSFEYSKEAVVGKWNKWVMLIIATILLGLPLMGYALKVLRGEKPAPEVEDWGTLFIDGIKYLIVAIIWMLPVYIVLGILMVIGFGAAMTGDASAAMAGIGIMVVGMIIVAILAIIIGLFMMIGVVRFARTGSIGEAFNFSAIRATIAKIGWVPYIIALIVLMVCGAIFGIVMGILMMIPILGWLLYLCMIPPWMLFVSRYICQLYDSVGA
jgi:hypothetical protein